jgi:hypothetical protein
MEAGRLDPFTSLRCGSGIVQRVSLLADSYLESGSRVRGLAMQTHINHHECKNPGIHTMGEGV